MTADQEELWLTHLAALVLSARRLAVGIGHP